MWKESAHFSWIPKKKKSLCGLFQRESWNSGTCLSPWGGQIKASVSLFSACVSSSLTILCSFTCAPHHRPGSWEIVRLLKRINMTKEVKFQRRWIETGLGGSGSRRRLSSLLLIWFQQSRRASLSWRGSKFRERPRWTPVRNASVITEL